MEYKGDQCHSSDERSTRGSHAVQSAGIHKQERQTSRNQLEFSSLHSSGCIDRSRHDDLSVRKQPGSRYRTQLH